MLEQRAAADRRRSFARENDHARSQNQDRRNAGPATDAPGVLEESYAAGGRPAVNFSHGEPGDHARRVQRAREAPQTSASTLRCSATCRPKIASNALQRRAVLTEAALHAGPGLDPHEHGPDGRHDLPDLARDVVPGDELILGDGQIELKVTATAARRSNVASHRWRTRRPQGINRRGGGLSAKALTDKDREDVQLAAQLDVDYLAVSFVRQARISRKHARC